MDMNEFTAKLEEATKKLSAEDRASLVKIFQSVSEDITKPDFVTSGPQYVEFLKQMKECLKQF